MCNCCGSSAQGVVLSCVSPLAWLGSWLTPEEDHIRMELRCQLLDDQINCLNQQKDSGDLTQNQADAVDTTLARLDSIKRQLECFG